MLFHELIKNIRGNVALTGLKLAEVQKPRDIELPQLGFVPLDANDIITIFSLLEDYKPQSGTAVTLDLSGITLGAVGWSALTEMLAKNKDITVTNVELNIDLSRPNFDVSKFLGSLKTYPAVLSSLSITGKYDILNKNLLSLMPVLITCSSLRSLTLKCEGGQVRQNLSMSNFSSVIEFLPQCTALIHLRLIGEIFAENKAFEALLEYLKNDPVLTRLELLASELSPLRLSWPSALSEALESNLHLINDMPQFSSKFCDEKQQCKKFKAIIERNKNKGQIAKEYADLLDKFKAEMKDFENEKHKTGSDLLIFANNFCENFMQSYFNQIRGLTAKNYYPIPSQRSELQKLFKQHAVSIIKLLTLAMVEPNAPFDNYYELAQKLCGQHGIDDKVILSALVNSYIQLSFDRDLNSYDDQKTAEETVKQCKHTLDFIKQCVSKLNRRVKLTPDSIARLERYYKRYVDNIFSCNYSFQEFLNLGIAAILKCYEISSQKEKATISLWDYFIEKMLQLIEKICEEMQRSAKPWVDINTHELWQGLAGYVAHPYNSRFERFEVVSLLLAKADMGVEFGKLLNNEKVGTYFGLTKKDVNTCMGKIKCAKDLVEVKAIVEKFCTAWGKLDELDYPEILRIKGIIDRRIVPYIEEVAKAEAKALVLQQQQSSTATTTGAAERATQPVPLPPSQLASPSTLFATNQSGANKQQVATITTSITNSKT